MSQPNPNGIMMALREKTQEAHVRTEAASPWYPLMKGEIADPEQARADYIDILERSLSVVRPLERAIREGLDPAARGALGPLLIQAPLIEADLKAMGVSDDKIAGIKDMDVPPLDTMEKKIGAAYTLIGSSMGGAQIAKQVGAHYDWPPLSHEVSSLKPYGNEIAAKFRGAFGGFAEAQFASGALDKDATIDAANMTFDLVGKALEGHRLANTTAMGEVEGANAAVRRRLRGGLGGSGASAVLAIATALGLGGTHARAHTPDPMQGPVVRMVDHVANDGPNAGGSWSERAQRTGTDIERS